jgi:hypothetical protein
MSEAWNDGVTENTAEPSRGSVWGRWILRILRVLLIPVLCLLSLFAGLGIGYVYLGGQPLSDIWQLSTWKHLIDLIFSNT